MSELISRSEVARLLKVTPNIVMNMEQKGVIPCRSQRLKPVAPGADNRNWRIYFVRSEIEAWMKKGVRLNRFQNKSRTIKAEPVGGFPSFASIFSGKFDHIEMQQGYLVAKVAARNSQPKTVTTQSFANWL